MFGYYIEVRNVHKDKVPQEWIRKQTLVNAERYITQELKEYEEKILGAEDKILVLETQLYAELVQSLSEFIPAIQTDANQIARLDCLLDRMLRLTGCFSALAGALFWVWGEPLALLLYHSQEAGFYLRVLGPAMPLMYLESMVDGADEGDGGAEGRVPVQPVGRGAPHCGGAAPPA